MISLYVVHCMLVVACCQLCGAMCRMPDTNVCVELNTARGTLYACLCDTCCVWYVVLSVACCQLSDLYRVLFVVCCMVLLIGFIFVCDVA